MSQRLRIVRAFRGPCRRVRLCAAAGSLAAALFFPICHAFAADGPKAPAQVPAPKAPKRIPPPGIAVPPDKRAALEKELDAFGMEIQALGRHRSGRVQSLLPDVQIFWQAVHNALADGEFFNPR